MEVPGKWNPVSGRTALVAGHSGHTIEAVQAEVRQCLADKVVVGWDVNEDLKSYLDIELAPGQALDIQKHYTYERCLELGRGGHHPLSRPKGTYYSLRLVAEHVLGRSIQRGPHNAVEDAQATMALYLRDRVHITTESCGMYSGSCS